ncbi:CidA/LrgA family protein [Methyloferula stellata]|uniref:CidA/LrgA family protein n=1 Tax=Methyloferula stellata TaxID=876270 RepID=UPI000363864E|nr:CidA/LrgA family protein [Methyloferula stellata]
MLKAILTLFLCLAAGDLINKLTGLPLPGGVIGLVILLAILIWRRGPDPKLRETSHFLLRNMTVLFIPASVGLVTQLPALKQDALPIGIAIVVSTVLGMAVTAAIMHWLARGGHPAREPQSREAQ